MPTKIEPMSDCTMMDFSRSYVTDTAARDGVEVNNCRAQVLASCQLIDQTCGTTRRYLICQACIGEHMYQPGQITQIPTAEVLVIYSDAKDQYMLLKKHADHRHDVVQLAKLWESVQLQDGGTAYRTALKISLPQVAVKPLPMIEQIFSAFFSNRRLVGRTTLRSDDGRWRAVLDYPIGYINCLPRSNSITVDVGPILIPDFAEMRDDAPIACLRPSFLIFKDLDQVEIVHRVPSAIEGSAATLHYSKVVHSAADCEVFAID